MKTYVCIVEFNRFTMEEYRTYFENTPECVGLLKKLQKIFTENEDIFGWFKRDGQVHGCFSVDLTPVTEEDIQLLKKFDINNYLHRFEVYNFYAEDWAAPMEDPESLKEFLHMRRGLSYD